MDILSRQPTEILDLTLSFLDLDDLRRVSCQCRKLRDYIQRSDLLWERSIFRACDIEPPGRLPAESRSALKTFRPYAEILTTSRRDVKQAHMLRLSDQLLNMLSQPESEDTPILTKVLGRLFDNDSNKSAFLWRSSLFQNTCEPLVAKYPQPTTEEAEKSAKLAVFYGVSLESGIEGLEVHPYARSRIYDLRRYTDDNGWGPFKDVSSGEVDWQRVLAIMVDLGYNLRSVISAFRKLATEDVALNAEERHLSDQAKGSFPNHPEKPFVGIAPYSFRSANLNATAFDARTELDEEDPYGVTGTWMRLVCFLDWLTLQAFNFGSANIPDDEDREPCTDSEAIRMIILKLRVTRIEAPSEDDHPDWPVVHFTGTSRSLQMAFDPNTNSRIRGRIRGTVRTTPSGSIRWTTFSIYHGEERWRSEGVQIGGIQSARGVMGTWFDKEYDDHGPAGPTAFWKLSNELFVEPKSY